MHQSHSMQKSEACVSGVISKDDEKNTLISGDL